MNKGLQFPVRHATPLPAPMPERTSSYEGLWVTETLLKMMKGFSYPYTSVVSEGISGSIPIPAAVSPKSNASCRVLPFVMTPFGPPIVQAGPASSQQASLRYNQLKRNFHGSRRGAVMIVARKGSPLASPISPRYVL